MAQYQKKLILFLLFVAILALVAFGYVLVHQRQDQFRRNELTKAQSELDQGYPRIAAKRLEPLVQQSPNDGEPRFLLGLCQAAMGRSQEALLTWELVPENSPTSGRALFHQAKIWASQGQLSKTETALIKAMDRDGPQRFDARWELVKMLRLQGRFDEARRIYLDGFTINIYPTRAGALRELQRLDTSPFPIEAAAQAFSQAFSLAPDDSRVQLGQAHVLMRQNRMEEAYLLIQQCRKSQPNDQASLRLEADWLLASNRVTEAANVVGQLLNYRDQERLALLVLAKLAMAGQITSTESHWLNQLTDQFPGEPQAWERLAELAVRAGYKAEADRLRNRKNQIEQSRVRYMQILRDDDYLTNAQELASLARELGQNQEAELWTELGQGTAQVQAKPLVVVTDFLSQKYPELSRGRIGTTQDSGKPELATIPVFEDRAEASGLKFTHENGDTSKQLTPPVTSSGGIGLLDYNNDGWLDVYVVQSGVFPPPDSGTQPAGDRLFRNRGDGTFEDVSKSSKIADLAIGYGHGVAVGDYDNDGDPDLLLTRWRRYLLLRNLGNGQFEDATAEAGLVGDRDWPTSAAFADLDRDGDLDLYVCHYLKWDEKDQRTCIDSKDSAAYHCNPLDFPALSDHLFRNDKGKFIDVTTEAGIVDRDGRGLGVVAIDVDDDGLTDLFIANDQTANQLYLNRGQWKFEEVGVASGTAANANGGYQAGMGVACGDWDNDSRPDLFVTNYYNESTTFFQNLGSGAFTDQTQRIGLAAPSKYLLGFGIELFDSNNDGWLDLITANGHVNDGRPQFPWKMPAQLLLNDGRGQVQNPGIKAGAPFQDQRVGRGLVSGDLDHDGHCDAILQGQNDPLIYFHNQSGSQKNSNALVIKLEGKRSNRDGVGAKVIARVGQKNWTRWRSGGGGYQSASDPRIRFGLSDSTKVNELEIQWPSQTIDRYNDVPAGFWICREGESRLVPMTALPRMKD